MLLVTSSCKLNVTVTLFEQKRNSSPTACVSRARYLDLCLVVSNAVVFLLLGDEVVAILRSEISLKGLILTG